MSAFLWDQFWWFSNLSAIKKIVKTSKHSRGHSECRTEGTAYKILGYFESTLQMQKCDITEFGFQIILNLLEKKKQTKQDKQAKPEHNRAADSLCPSPAH